MKVSVEGQNNVLVIAGSAEAFSTDLVDENETDDFPDEACQLHDAFVSKHIHRFDDPSTHIPSAGWALSYNNEEISIIRSKCILILYIYKFIFHSSPAVAAAMIHSALWTHLTQPYHAFLHHQSLHLPVQPSQLRIQLSHCHPSHQLYRNPLTSSSTQIVQLLKIMLSMY